MAFSALKVWLSKRALDNWMKRQPRKFGREKESTIYPKSFTQIGIVADEQETVAERPARLTNSLVLNKKYFLKSILQIVKISFPRFIE